MLVKVIIYNPLILHKLVDKTMRYMLDETALTNYSRC